MWSFFKKSVQLTAGVMLFVFAAPRPTPMFTPW
jgi:hypothetical protein